MNWLVITLVVVLVSWMAACGWCGFRIRFGLFAGVMLAGLVANQLWMMIGLQAPALEPNLILAQAAAVCYGLTAFGVGWLSGRIARQWRASEIEG